MHTGWTFRAFEPEPPLDAPRGERARSRYGRFGQGRWSHAIEQLIDDADPANRLRRGAWYARRGQVMDLEIRAGRVSALVQGTRLTPYYVEIECAPLNRRHWAGFEQILSSRQRLARRVERGELPPELHWELVARSIPLVPRRQELTTSCTCPDEANPCKHIAAVLYLFTEHLDTDPQLLLRWRGRRTG